MGSTITRDNRSLNSDGFSIMSLTTPTLTIGGVRDGIMRVSRMAESYYHQVNNIELSQQAEKHYIY